MPDKDRLPKPDSLGALFARIRKQARKSSPPTGTIYAESHKLKQPTRYDNVEVQPVVAIDLAGKVIEPRSANQTILAFEQCEESDPNIYQWSIYLHNVNGGLSCIADCPTKLIAETISEILKANLDKLQTI